MAKQLHTTPTKEEKISIDEAFNILDRIIGFINNCDTKTSIILGGALAIIAVVFSTDGLTKIYNITKLILQPNIGKPTGVGVLYITLLLIFAVVLTVGLIFLVLSLVGRTSSKVHKSCKNSKIFFGHISSVDSPEKFRKSIFASSKDDLLNDILNQIYINSKICSKKFKLYNWGLCLSIIGLGMMIVLFVIGVFYF